jgi:hypothetical protein
MPTDVFITFNVYHIFFYYKTIRQLFWFHIENYQNVYY